MSIQQQLDELLKRVHEGVASPEDYRKLRNLINDDLSGDTIARVHAFHASHATDTTAYNAQQWNNVVQDILNTDKQGLGEAVEPGISQAPVHQLHILRRRWGWIAAAVLVLLAGGSYLFTLKGPKAPLPEVTVTAVKKPVDILPGKNGAVLTLADGSRIVLDSLADGVVAKQQSTEVALKDGKLMYDVSDSPLPAPDYRLAYNTLSTPRGSQYQVMLPDGTKAWLNAASSLRFPTAFTGNTREIEITGEVYLEVAKNAAMPFKVKTNATIIEVLGTHFNVNAYNDEEAVTTTLLEGKVTVKTETSAQSPDNRPRISVTLKPGEQVRTDRSGNLLQLAKPVNVDEVVAWKNGFFHFREAQLPVVMRQLSRWYDVDVAYEGRPDQNMTFSGKMGRDLKLAQVLKILQKSEVHFAIQDRKIVVIP